VRAAAVVTATWFISGATPKKRTALDVRRGRVFETRRDGGVFDTGSVSRTTSRDLS